MSLSGNVSWSKKDHTVLPNVSWAVYLSLLVGCFSCCLFSASIAFAQDLASVSGRPGNSESLVELETITQMLSRFERQVALNNLLDNASVEMLERFFDQVENLNPLHLREMLQETIVRKHALLDPVGTVGLVASSTVSKSAHQRYMVALFEEWSIFGLNDAVNHAAQLASPQGKWAMEGIWSGRRDLPDEELHSIARRLGEENLLYDLTANSIVGEPVENPRKLWNQLVGDYGSNLEQLSNAQRQALSYVAKALVKAEGAQEYKNVVQAFSEKKERAWLLCELLEGFYLDYPDVSIAVATHAKSHDREVLLSAIDNWAREDGWNAFEAARLVDNESGGDPTRLQRSVIVSWSKSKPHALIHALPRLPIALQDWTRETVLLEMSYTFPESVPEYLKDVTDKGRRDMIITNFVRRWAAIDPLAAYEWASSDPLTADRPEGHYTSIALDAAVRRNPHSALPMALSLPEAKDGVGAEAHVIKSIAGRDIDLAVQMLESARNHDTRQVALPSIGLAMVRENASSRAVELIAHESENDQLRYFEAFAWIWAGEKPLDLLSNFESLPTEKVKQHCAKRLLLENQIEPFLKREDVDKIRSYVSTDADIELLESSLN